MLVIKKVHVDRNSPRSSNNWRPCGDGLYEVFQAWCTGVQADAGGATAGREGERRLALPKDAPREGGSSPLAGLGAVLGSCSRMVAGLLHEPLAPQGSPG